MTNRLASEMKTPMFWVLVALTVLIAIVAVGNWQLYSRVETIEKLLALK